MRRVINLRGCAKPATADQLAMLWRNATKNFDLSERPEMQTHANARIRAAVSFLGDGTKRAEAQALAQHLPYPDADISSYPEAHKWLAKHRLPRARFVLQHEVAPAAAVGDSEAIRRMFDEHEVVRISSAFTMAEMVRHEFPSVPCCRGHYF
eukprot:SAG31_NODE_1391_length_8535_cov_11.998696_7_plen_152_part_00